MNESDRLEFALTHLKDWDRFESFANGFLSEMYPNLRPIAGTNDKGRDAVLFESDEPSVVLQYSIVEDWRGKIRNTVTRLSDAGLSFSVLVYATNQSIGPKADELKKELRASGLALDIWDRPQFLSRIYKSRATVAVSQELARRVVDPLLPAEEVVKNSNLTVPELKAGLLYLELQLRDVESNLGLTKLCFQSLVLAALASTGPEATKSRTEIREHVHRQFPSHDRDRLNQLVDGALERLKNRGRVTWTGASDSFALHYNERVELAERARGILVRFGQQHPLPPTTASQAWDRMLSGASPGSLGELAPFILHNADPTARREMVGGVGARQTADEPPTHPLHYMEDDRTLLLRLSELSQEVFGYSLTLDTTSTALLLRVGTPSIQAPRVDESQAAYRADMAKLPPLSQQGDGMRSFLGLLLPLITASHPIVLVDEPEAFLHPPQAAALGRALSTLAKNNKLQVILATHDRNLLTGLLDVVDVPISIVRLHRDRDLTVPYQLNPDDVRDLWADVTLRYTNVIDGLFHRLVIIAEADRDCRFYAAALDAVHEDAPLAIPPSEVLFVPSNGKQGMARLVRALKAVHTPVVTSPDLDILNDEGVLRALVRELGGAWESIAQDYKIATDPFRQPRDPARNSDVLAAIQGVLGPSPEQTYNADTRDKVLAHLRSNESRWQALKTAGDRAFTGAQATAAGHRLLNSLDAMGVVTVRVGQLERFAPTVEAGKGPAWLAAALERNAYKNADVIAHIQRLLQSGLEKVQLPETASGASSGSVSQTSSDESSQTNTPPR